MSASIENAGKVYPLAGNQRAAVNPEDNVWLSASAGTGKTQVLSARVLRLLLRRDVDPSQILCLTFTKAGAAEMANRINSVLARWVRLDDVRLQAELKHLGAESDVATRDRARTLFASVLDCPGGGLRIDTIHAFSQWLLANFPVEADLAPGSRPMEDRERELLAREVLSDLLVSAEAIGDADLLDAVSLFTTLKDPGALHNWLMRCASAAEMWKGPAAWQRPMRARVHRLLEIPVDAGEEWALESLHPDTFPDHHLTAILPLMQAWNANAGRDSAEFIPRWLACAAEERASLVGEFFDTLLTKKGEPRKMANPTKADPQLPERQQEIAEAVGLYFERRGLLDLATLLTASFEVGGAFATLWEKAKAREGLLDFDDLIRKAAALLSDTDASAWIRYKLDRQFDHILIDEAQDTNEAQWQIVDALIDDFFSGEGASGDKLRTIFTVGDYKQAIFGFQGTSPENFARAKHRVRSAIMAARENAGELRDRRRIPNWQELDLGQSFRTSKPVLDFVNTALETLGHEAFGLDAVPEPHVGAERPGLVTLWHPVRAENMLDDPEEERDWLPAHETVMAERIAEQVRRWVDGEEPFVLAKGDAPRHAEPGDVMVLVRKRKELASQIVAKLHAKGVPVAGVDRLRLGAPLAVKDIMAALRFAAQPLDDLSLANVLSSPLIGWSQDDLLQFVPRDEHVRLWHHLRESSEPRVAESVERLKQLLARADFETPQALISWLLTGSWRGRERLIARLGREANDPIDELVNAAFAFESAHVPSLAGFIEWFDAGEGELKRDADEASGQVRVMTVHGSKGLQAPIVILADATGRPGQGGDLELPDDPLEIGDARKVPLPKLSKDHKRGPVEGAEEAASLAEMEEHWRLLYVAMTRAEEALFIGGSLGSRDKNGPHEDSWYARLKPVFDGAELDDTLWGARQEWGYRAEPLAVAGQAATGHVIPELPQWAVTPIGPEPKPPRPLAPSSAGEEQGADPPLAPEIAKAAARRGVLIHRLLERLPDIAPDIRKSAAEAWLARQAGELNEEERSEMLESALAVLDHSGFHEIFAPGALAEVPLTATVGGVVISGTADRLLVTRDQVTVVDFKTTRRPPQLVDDIPLPTLKQMAAYAAALSNIYPDRTIRAAVLYTHAPVLFEVPAAVLGLHKDRLGETQETYVPADIE